MLSVFIARDDKTKVHRFIGAGNMNTVRGRPGGWRKHPGSKAKSRAGLPRVVNPVVRTSSAKFCGVKGSPISVENGPGVCYDYMVHAADPKRIARSNIVAGK